MSCKLEFSTTSLLNTIISDEADKYYYEVLTPDWQPFVTTVRRLDLITGKFLPVAEIANTTDSKCSPVSVKLVDEWLHSDDNKSWRIRCTDDQWYLWIAIGDHLELVGEDNLDMPLVVHHPGKTYFHFLSTTQDLSLDIAQSVVNILDTIIGSSSSSAAAAIASGISAFESSKFDRSVGQWRLLRVCSCALFT